MTSTEDWFRYILLSTVIIMPSLAITARFALKPLVDSITEAIPRLREALGEERASMLAASLAEEVRELRSETANLREEVARLSEVENFHRQLQMPDERHLPHGS